MGIIGSIIGGIFSNSTSKTINTIATGIFEKDTKSAEAKALMVKTLDPSGNMRISMSRTVMSLYSLYILVMLLLIVLEFFGIGEINKLATATDKLTDLFGTISATFGLIISASFGVSAMNVKRGI